MKLQFPR